MIANAMAGRGDSRSVREIKLDPDPASVRQARHFLRSNLCDLGFHDSADDAALIVSELVTNSVREAPNTPCLVVVGAGAGHPFIEVHDCSPELPKKCEPDFVAQHGRGLHVVDALCVQWECVRSETGKAVIVKLP